MALDESRFKRTVIESSLRSSQLLWGLPAEDIESIAAMVVPKRLEKGDYLFRKGDPAEGFYILQRGAINVHRVSPLGKEQVLHVFRPFESFAEAALAAPAGYPADARAITSSSVLLVPKRDFIQLLRKRPELALRMLGSMSQHLRVIVGLLDDLTLKDIETRLANWLLRRCAGPIADTAQIIQLQATKRVLASEMGTTSETLSRTLAKFRELKLLRVSGNTITVTRPRALERLLQRHLREL
jgi:CRP/FNR family transcriptional regulator, dissimilatory nitrate respiration regulator